MLKKPLLGAGVLVLVLGWPVVSLLHRSAGDGVEAPDPVPSVEIAEPAGELSWTVEQANAAIADGPIARLPGSPAVIDEQRVREAFAGTDRRVLLLPYSGVETREGHDEQVREVRDAFGPDGLVVVSGLAVSSAGAGSVVPGSMDEARQVLATGDLTTFVLTGVDERSR